MEEDTVQEEEEVVVAEEDVDEEDVEAGKKVFEFRSVRSIPSIRIPASLLDSHSL